MLPEVATLNDGKYDASQKIKRHMRLGKAGADAHTLASEVDLTGGRTYAIASAGSAASRPAEATEWEERKWRSREARRPIREDAIVHEGLPVAPDERPTASDNFVPPEYREKRLVVGEGIFDDQRQRLHAGEDTRCGIGPGMVPTREASGGGVFAEGRTHAHAGRDGAGDLGPDLVPKSETPTGFLHGAANYDYRSSGFRGGGGWKV